MIIVIRYSTIICSCRLPRQTWLYLYQTLDYIFPSTFCCSIISFSFLFCSASFLHHLCFIKDISSHILLTIKNSGQKTAESSNKNKANIPQNHHSLVILLDHYTSLPVSCDFSTFNNGLFWLTATTFTLLPVSFSTLFLALALAQPNCKSNPQLLIIIIMQ